MAHCAGQRRYAWAACYQYVTDFRVRDGRPRTGCLESALSSCHTVCARSHQVPPHHERRTGNDPNDVLPEGLKQAHRQNGGLLFSPAPPRVAGSKRARRLTARLRRCRKRPTPGWSSGPRSLRWPRSSACPIPSPRTSSPLPASSRPSVPTCLTFRACCSAMTRNYRAPRDDRSGLGWM
jgi:hypothetical protein